MEKNNENDNDNENHQPLRPDGHLPSSEGRSWGQNETAMENKKIKVVAPVDTSKLADTGESVAIKGTLYIQPNGDQFFEAIENHPRNVSKKNGYELVFSDGVVKHYTTRRRHIFYVSVAQPTNELVGSFLPRMVVRFCAAASAKKIRYYVKEKEPKS